VIINDHIISRISVHIIVYSNLRSIVNKPEEISPKLAGNHVTSGKDFTRDTTQISSLKKRHLTLAYSSNTIAANH